MLYLGADHRGYPLKEKIKAWLKQQGVSFEDLGATDLDPADDYTDYAAKVGEAVSKNPAVDRGILLCGAGAGICVAANKFKGVRSALAQNPEMARAMRHDDDINVLCLASDFLDEKTAEQIVEVWLKTPFGKEERYIRRMKKIQELER